MSIVIERKRASQLDYAYSIAAKLSEAQNIEKSMSGHPQGPPQEDLGPHLDRPDVPYP